MPTQAERQEYLSLQRFMQEYMPSVLIASRRLQDMAGIPRGSSLHGEEKVLATLWDFPEPTKVELSQSGGPVNNEMEGENRSSNNHPNARDMYTMGFSTSGDFSPSNNSLPEEVGNLDQPANELLAVQGSNDVYHVQSYSDPDDISEESSSRLQPASPPDAAADQELDPEIQQHTEIDQAERSPSNEDDDEPNAVPTDQQNDSEDTRDAVAGPAKRKRTLSDPPHVVEREPKARNTGAAVATWVENAPQQQMTLPRPSRALSALPPPSSPPVSPPSRPKAPLNLAERTPLRLLSPTPSPASAPEDYQSPSPSANNPAYWVSHLSLDLCTWLDHPETLSRQYDLTGLEFRDTASNLFYSVDPRFVYDSLKLKAMQLPEHVEGLRDWIVLSAERINGASYWLVAFPSEAMTKYGGKRIAAASYKSNNISTEATPQQQDEDEAHVITLPETVAETITLGVKGKIPLVHGRAVDERFLERFVTACAKGEAVIEVESEEGAVMGKLRS